MKLCYLTTLTMLLVEAVFIYGQALKQSQTELLLQKYYFLSPSLQEYGRNTTTEEYQSAIRDLQFMAGLPETGEMDEQTEQKLIGQRCGRVDDIREFRNNTNSEISGLTRKSYSWAIVRYLRGDLIVPITAVIKNAFTFWTAETGLRFSELIVGDPKTADIQIAFVSGFHGDSIIIDGTGGVAHAWGAGETIPLAIHFDDSVNWSLTLDGSTPPNKLSLLDVVTHEIGHVLGLQHSANSSSIMYPWFNKSVDQQLTDDDREALKLLYSHETDVSVSTTESTAPTAMPENSTNIPAACPGSVDAALVTKKMMFFFKNDRVWSTDIKGNLIENGTSIHLLWYGLPSNLTKIDAVYLLQRGSSRVIFFIKNKYFMFKTNMRRPSAPKAGRPITDYCLPPGVKHIDAVFSWGHNNMTYLISGDMYWRFDETADRARCPENPIYPKLMRVWGDVPLPVDAALKSHNGNLYFFHKEHYWEFDDWSMSINTTEQHLINDWIGCEVKREDNPTTTVNSASVQNMSLLVVILSIYCYL